jgi:hypothetical protein
MANLKEKIEDLFKGNTKAMYASIILVSLFVCAVLAFIIQASSKSGKKKLNAIATPPFVADSDLLIPEGPLVFKGYALSHESNSHWTKDDLDKWFTVPSDTTIEQLDKDNEKIISDILGDAP